MNKIRLIDVADAAGVSKSTVSQFLNGRFDYMSKDTRARIQQAVETLNYVPNNIARSLKTDRTRTVGVIVRDIAGFYTSQALRGMDDYCKREGYNLLIYNSDFDSGTEARALSSLGQMRVDGLLIAPSGLNETLISGMESQGTPVVQFQLEREDSDRSIILSNYRQAAFDATEYLIELGHSRICFVTQEYKTVKSRLERYQGYAEALARHDIRVDEQLVLYWHRDTGFESAPLSLLGSDAAPTAFFTQHLALTTDLLQALNDAHIRIPEDVSLIGFDELPMADFFKVPITVVRQDPYVVGKEAARLLIRQLREPGRGIERILVPCALVERDSCKNLLAN